MLSANSSMWKLKHEKYIKKKKKKNITTENRKRTIWNLLTAQLINTDDVLVYMGIEI